MKYRLSLLIVLALVLIAGCGGGSGGRFHAAICNNGEKSKKNSCTEACDEQGGVRQWLTENCGPNP